jgi:predicted kinase
MHGYSGSGKTWVSSRLMSQLPAVRVRSDIERKRRFGLDENASSDSLPGKGIYSNQAKAGVYESLIETAGALLWAGFNVIIDASFLKQTDRQSAVALAERQKVSMVFVDTSADRPELDRRLREREVRGGDASEADIEVLRHQFDRSEPLVAAERKHTVFVTTDASIDLDHIIKSINRI